MKNIIFINSRNFKKYLFINYIINNEKHKIILHFNDDISDEFKGAFDDLVKGYKWNDTKIKNKLFKIDNDLYLSEDLFLKYKNIYNNNNLIYNFSKYITCKIYDQIIGLIIYK